MSAILACNFGQILDSYEAMRCIAYLGREAARIIAALGIRTEAVFGLEPTVGNLGFASVEELHKVIFQYWPTIYTPSRPGRSSMLQDLEKGRKSEID
jgi:ketopantoate reductase